MKLYVKIIPLFIGLIVLGAGYAIAHPLDFGICPQPYEWNGSIRCHEGELFSAGWPMYNFGLYFVPIGLVLLFVGKNQFVSWFKFAWWFIPLTILLVWMDPLDTTGQTFAFFDVSASGVAYGLGLFFLMTSTAIIIRSYINTVFLGEAQRAVRTIWWRQLIHPAIFIGSIIWFLISFFSSEPVSLNLSLFSLGATFFMLFLRSIDFKFFFPLTLVFWSISTLLFYLTPFTTTLAYILGISYVLLTLGIIMYHIYISRMQKI